MNGYQGYLPPTSPGGPRGFPGAAGVSPQAALDMFQASGADMASYMQAASPQPLQQLHMKGVRIFNFNFSNLVSDFIFVSGSAAYRRCIQRISLS